VRSHCVCAVFQNFTIQLTGRKRWSISPGVFCPITNHTNPKNIATEKYDVRHHVLFSATSTTPGQRVYLSTACAVVCACAVVRVVPLENEQEHRKVHASYAPAADVEPPKDFSQAQTFVLRSACLLEHRLCGELGLIMGRVRRVRCRAVCVLRAGLDR
jgi:hypothetical protein